jgi:hypothetical protein
MVRSVLRAPQLLAHGFFFASRAIGSMTVNAASAGRAAIGILLKGTLTRLTAVISQQGASMALKRKRPYVVAVQVNEQERQELKRAAARAGLALSVFLRAVGLASARQGGVSIAAP